MLAPVDAVAGGLDHRARPGLAHARQRRRVGQRPGGGGEDAPAAHVSGRLGSSEQRQRPGAVRPGAAAVEAKLIQAPGADRVAEHEQPAAAAIEHREHRGGVQGGGAPRVGEQRPGQRQRGALWVGLGAEPLPAGRRVGGRDRGVLVLGEVRPAAAGLRIADDRDAEGAVVPGSALERVVDQRRVVALDPLQSRRDALGGDGLVEFAQASQVGSMFSGTART